MPAKEWTLIRDDDGSLLSIIYNHNDGQISNYRSIKVKRGDILQFRLNPVIDKRLAVSRGDTVAYLSSSEMHDRLLRLEDNLNEAKALLVMTQTGEKEDLIEKANAQHEAASKRAEYESGLAKRDEELYKRRLISKQEFESSLTSVKIAILEESIAMANLQATKSGDKPERLHWIEVQIKSIENEITSIRSRLQDLIIQSPFDGNIRRSSASDTIAVIESLERMIIFYLDIRHLSEIEAGQTVRFSSPAFISDIFGTIDQIDHKMRMLPQAQAFAVTAVLDKSPHPHFSHVGGVATVYTGKQTIRQWFYQFINFLAAGQ